MKYFLIFTAIFFLLMFVLDYAFVSVDYEKFVEAARVELRSKNISDEDVEFEITRVEARLWKVVVKKLNNKEKIYYSNSNREVGFPSIMTFDAKYRLVDYDQVFLTNLGHVLFKKLYLRFL